MSLTPPYSDSREWITAYLAIHSLSVPSQRYSFLLWLTVVISFLATAVLHWTGSTGGLCGAIWSKWSLRRRTWRKQHVLAIAQKTNQPHRQPTSFPSNAQLLSLAALTLASLTLAFAGPDYLAPDLKVWQIHVRSFSPSRLYDTSAFEPYMPQYTISKSLWSSSARTGQIAFALLPLCVLFAIKAPPFAILAIPFMIQLYFDKLAWLHRWAGRLVWFLTFIHVVLWSIQLTKDVNPSTGRIAYIYAWSYTPFIYGWIAFVLLTLIILLSLYPIRRRFYEHFYILHILLVPCMLVFAGLHHPTVGWWCWAALSIWIGERLWRGTWWIYANGIISRVAFKSLPVPTSFKNSPSDSLEMDFIHRLSVESTRSHLRITEGRTPSPLGAYYAGDDGPVTADRDSVVSKARPLAPPLHSTEQNLSRIPISHRPLYIPPPGYAHAELLSARTMRLRLITPGFLPWSPGQHFLLNIPSVSRFTSHPFTCASVCDEEAPTDEGRMILFLVRAKSGWTQDLWNLVSRMTAERSRGDVSPTLASDSLPKNGVLLRAYVDGPFGSAKRVRWGNYSTAVIITGGSGISFGLSLLQYMCMCMTGRDGRYLGGRPGGWGRKGADLKRVRFIWLVREYSHIQWCASVIRRCMSAVRSPALQVDIFVTKFKPVPQTHPVYLDPPHARFGRKRAESGEELEPPHPNFIRESSTHRRSRSTDSVETHDSYESDVDLSYYIGENLDNQPPADEMYNAHETNILDLTNFDGDVDVSLPGEAYLCQRLKKEGKLRRLRSGRLSLQEKVNQDARSAHMIAYDEVQASRRAQDPRQAYPEQHTTRSRPPHVPFPTRKTIALSTQSTDGLLAIPTFSERRNSSLSETDYYSAISHHSESLPRPYSPSNSVSLSSNTPSTVSLVTTPGGPIYPAKSYHDVQLESEELQVVEIPPLTTNAHYQGSQSARLLSSTSGALDPQPRFHMDRQEAADVNAVSEHARPGKPKLDKVIIDEVEASRGAVVVACCGPTSLNALVRKIVAMQIDPWRIRRGDPRGSITLVTEEFNY